MVALWWSSNVIDLLERTLFGIEAATEGVKSTFLFCSAQTRVGFMMQDFCMLLHEITYNYMF